MKQNAATLFQVKLAMKMRDEEKRQGKPPRYPTVPRASKKEAVKIVDVSHIDHLDPEIQFTDQERDDPLAQGSFSFYGFLVEQLVVSGLDTSVRSIVCQIPVCKSFMVDKGLSIGLQISDIISCINLVFYGSQTIFERFCFRNLFYVFKQQFRKTHSTVEALKQVKRLQPFLY